VALYRRDKAMTKELLQQPIPLMFRPFFGVGNSPLTKFEQLAGAAGLKISRYSPQHDIYKLFDKFGEESTNPKVKADYERNRKETRADSDYKPMREYLINEDYDKAREEYDKLLETKKSEDIVRAIRPYSHVKIPGTDIYERHDKPFSGSRQIEALFKKSLDAEGKKKYKEAQEERLLQYKRFQEMLKRPKTATPPQTTAP